jgi:hypothetical protein
MSERLTVVFDDAGLYRRLKVRAAESGQPLKRIVEDALVAYLGPEAAEPKPFDWAAYDSWQEEMAELNAALPPEEDDGQLLEYRPRPSRPLAMLAEERAPYDPR